MSVRGDFNFECDVDKLRSFFIKFKYFLFQLDLNMTDPMELLSYLGPSENSNTNSGSNTVGNTGSNQNSSNSTSNNNDDLLALFE